VSEAAVSANALGFGLARNRRSRKRPSDRANRLYPEEGAVEKKAAKPSTSNCDAEQGTISGELNRQIRALSTSDSFSGSSAAPKGYVPFDLPFIICLVFVSSTSVNFDLDVADS
jgi:hypothetical protein